MREVALERRAVEALDGIARPADMRGLRATLRRGAERLAGRTVWHVNSTAEGGGVAELLHQLLGYLIGAGIGSRWAVIEGTPEFFAVTKRIHNRLHGATGDGGPLGSDERTVYDSAIDANVGPFLEGARPGDVVVLHDPQTAGFAGPLAEAGLLVIWVCHVGVDTANDLVRSAWDFLRADVEHARALVFSRSAYVWDGLTRPVDIIPPCIDPTAPKNVEISPAAALVTLQAAGVVGSLDHEIDAEPVVPVRHLAESVEEAPAPPDHPIVMQISRWDRLKDHIGVLDAFVRYVDPVLDAHLVLAGPAAASVDDDPEATDVLAENIHAWRHLASEQRRRVHLVSLPMDDPIENAFIVNALQRSSTVVVQKSLAEGFGLTVAEAMWKTRPVVASRVGGIQDQIEDGRSGSLIEPTDGPALGLSVTSLIRDLGYADAIGHAGRERIREHFLPTRFLSRYVELIDSMIPR
jgi:trehalose synthase